MGKLNLKIEINMLNRLYSSLKANHKLDGTALILGETNRTKFEKAAVLIAEANQLLQEVQNSK